MIDYNNYLITELDDDQDKKYIEKTILTILKEQKVSLSQARCIFKDILWKIETENIINL